MDGTVRKLPMVGYAGGFSEELVEYPRRHPGTGDNNNDNTKTEYINKKERMHREMNAVYWVKLLRQSKGSKPSESCIELMYWDDVNKTQTIATVPAHTGSTSSQE
jgi:hypothetical protein